jgi:hypothetical protein
MDMKHGGKDKVQNNDKNNINLGDKDCLDGYHEDNTTTYKSQCDHDDSNPSDHNCVCCHSYQLRDVVVTMSTSVVETTMPMMTDLDDDFNQSKSHLDHDASNTSD